MKPPPQKRKNLFKIFFYNMRYNLPDTIIILTNINYNSIMHLYFFYNSHSQISANNFVGKDLSEETLEDFLQSIRMLDHPFYRSHNLEEIMENCYHLNVVNDNGYGEKPWVMAIIYKKPVTTQEMEIYNKIQNILLKHNSKEIAEYCHLLEEKIEDGIQKLMMDKPEDLDKIYGRYIFYLNYVKDIKLDHMLGTSSKDKKIDW